MIPTLTNTQAYDVINQVVEKFPCIPADHKVLQAAMQLFANLCNDDTKRKTEAAEKEASRIDKAKKPA